MITLNQYIESMKIVNQFLEEQQEIINSKRMTIESFRKKIPRKEGWDGTIRLITCLENINDTSIVFVDQITRSSFLKIRNAGEQTYKRFIYWRKEIGV